MIDNPIAQNRDSTETFSAVLGKHLIPGQALSPESLAAYYDSNAVSAGEQYDANDWAKPEQMYSQFEYLTSMVDLNGKTLLDVGAGNGLLIEYLALKNITPASITAIDISSEQINVLRTRFPNVEAIAADFFRYEFEQSYDVVSMLGVAPCLRFIFPNKDPRSAMLRLLDRALRYAKYGVVMSFLNKNCYESCETEHYEYMYHYPEEVCALLSGAKFDLSTLHNDLVTNCFLFCDDAAGEPFRFNLNKIDEALGLLK